MIYFKVKEVERYRSFLTQKIDFESQNFAHFDNFYSSDCWAEKLYNVLVVVFGPKGRPGKMCDGVR